MRDAYSYSVLQKPSLPPRLRPSLATVTVEAVFTIGIAIWRVTHLLSDASTSLAFARNWWWPSQAAEAIGTAFARCAWCSNSFICPNDVHACHSRLAKSSASSATPNN